jgi:ABC-type dipeptide/oligopeptide/nickel transport system permease component
VKLRTAGGLIGRWLYFIGRRLLSAAAAMLGVTILVFIVTHLMGDPVYLIIGQRGTQEQIVQLRHALGYDRPIWVQYFDYMSDVLHLNLGTSVYTQQPVATEIAQRFPSTVELTVAAMILGLAWTIPLGVASAARPGGVLDRFSQAVVEFGVAMPSFWLGLLLLFVFYYILRIAPTPVGELDFNIPAPPHITGLIVLDSALSGDIPALISSLSHLVLPAITLAVTACPPILQLTRNTMMDVLRSDYVRGARSLGIPRRIVYWKYALRNALLPVITMSAMTFGYLLGGTVLVETVFAWPGIGRYAVQSMGRFDYSPVLGIVLLAAAAYITVYFFADLINLLIDPRARAS